MAERVKTQIRIEIADMSLLDAVTPLFDAYRVSCGEAANPPEARHFLFDRILNHESVIYVAFADNQAVGLLQMYPFFSAEKLQPLWILADLYVEPGRRRQGIARALAEKAAEFVRAREDWGLVLKTARHNAEAKAFFESIGFRPVDRYDHYALTV